MTINQKNLVKYTLLACIFLARSLLFAQETEALDEPEIAIPKINTDLNNIDHRLSAADGAVDEQSNSAQVLTAEQQLVNGKEQFLKGQFRTCIRSLNAYLNLVQDSKTNEHIQAQHMLGYSYEQIGNTERALRAYLRYLESQTTNPDINKMQLMETVRRVLNLTVKDKTTAVKEKLRILAAITGMQVSAAEKAEILLYAVQSAGILVDAATARTWVQEAQLLSSTDPNMLSRLDFQQAAIYEKEGKSKEAEAHLEKIRSSHSPLNPDLLDLATLTLARSKFRSGNIALAASLYEEIATSSIYHSKALYEKTFAYASVKNYAAGLAAAQAFLTSYPSSKESITLRGYLAMLQLESGSSQEANQNLSIVIEKLDALDHGLKAQLMDSMGFSKSYLEKFLQEYPGKSDKLLWTNFIINTENKLSELKTNLNDSENELYAHAFSLANISTNTIKPLWAQQGDLIHQNALQSFYAASKLMALAEHFIGDALSPLARMQLQKSRLAREELLSKTSDLRRKRDTWNTWRNYFTISKSLGSKLSTLYASQANLTGQAQMARSRNYPDEEKITKLQAVQRKEVELLMTSLRDLYLLKFKNAHAFAPIMDDQKLFKQLTQQLFEEYTIIEQALDTDKRYALRVAKDDFRQSWSKWQEINKRLDRLYTTSISDMKVDLARMSDNTLEIFARHNELEETFANLKAQYQRLKLQNHTNIYDELHVTVESDLSRYRKWKADLNWSAAQSLRTDQEALRSRLAIELESAKSTLESIQ